MFENIKKLRQIQQEEQKLQKLKEELMSIEKMLDDKCPKIDISNTFVFYIDGIYHFVKKEMVSITGNTVIRKNEHGYRTTLRDIFSNAIVYEKSATSTISRREVIFNEEKFYFKESYASFYPIHELEHSLLAYIDNLVPTYVLQQLYYKVNGIDLSAHILKKKK